MTTTQGSEPDPAARDSFRLPRLPVGAVVVLGVGQAATLIAFLLLVRSVVGSIGPGGAEPATGRTTLLQLGLLFGVVLVNGCLQAWEFSVSEKIGYAVVQRLRMEMYGHLQGMTPSQLQYRARGGLILRMVGDLSMLRTWISRGLLGGGVALIVLVPTLGVLTYLDYRLGLTLVAVFAAGTAVSLDSGRVVRQATRTMRRRRSLVIGNLDEQINSLPVVQVFGRAGQEYRRLSKQNDSLTASLYRVAELRGRLRGISSAVALLAVVSALAVGLLEVRRGTATIGLVVAAVLVSRLLTSPVRTLGLAHDYWHRGRVSRQKVRDFLRSSSRGLEPTGLEELRVRKGGIEMRDVTVPGALEGVTLSAPPGQLVAVTGPAGSGKSTLLALVARLADPTGGEVVVDGQPLAATTLRSVFRKIGFVGPDLPLMRGTVEHNLTYSRPDVDRAEVSRVTYESGLDRVLGDLPQGTSTWVVEGGRNLAAGQRALVALARALLGNPPILLLDQPSAHLDAAGKAQFRRLITHHHGTVLLVTSDPDEIALADQVWVLDHGRVVETTPAPLLARGAPAGAP